MPRPLPQRFTPDSIREFRASARVRHEDGVSAAEAGRRTAAIYLWGYSAEMTLKAAYFALIGFADRQPITLTDLRAARTHAVGVLGVTWPTHSLHDLRGWADSIVAERTVRGWHYPDPAVGRSLRRQVQVLGRLWSETLRYHKNRAYDYEVRQAREAVEWLIANSARF
jgi:hypothetical protein